MSDLIRALGVGEPRKTSVIDGVALAYHDTGSEGVPVLCLHATGHGGGDFDGFRESVGSRCRVISLDFPGHGYSQPDHVPASAARYASLLGPFLDSIGLESVVLLGNSIGGAAAIEFCAACPDRVTGLVLADPGGLFPVDRVSRGFCRLMVGFFRAGVRGARWYRPAFSAYYRTILRESGAHDRRAAVVAAAYEIAPLLVESWQSFAKPEADIRALGPRIVCPVWFAWAKSDQIVAYRRSKEAIETFPDATVQLFRGGHSAFLEDRDAFLKGFLSFLDRVSRQDDSPDC